MVKHWIGIALIVTLSMAACMPATPAAPAGDETPAPTEEAAVEATAAPVEEATAEATEEAATAEPAGEATAEATQEATEEPSEEPAEAPAEEAVDIQALVSQMLAQELQIDASEVEVVSVEEVEWPDACLGVYSADIMCAQVITPGYRVILEADGQQYEYHTNLDGSSVQLAEAPKAEIGDLLIEWQQTLDTCQAGLFGRNGIIFGPCMGVQMGGKLVSPERESELADLIATYAPFEADSAAGVVNFHGQGSNEATPAEQRMVAEWARQATLEASTGHAAASQALAFAWHREGGIAGFCDDLTTYITGQLFAASCKGQPAETFARRRMNADELAQLYTWVDQVAPFEYHHDDGVVADSMSTTLIFSGAGSTAADEATQQQILEFASDLYTEVSRS